MTTTNNFVAHFTEVEEGNEEANVNFTISGTNPEAQEFVETILSSKYGTEFLDTIIQTVISEVSCSEEGLEIETTSMDDIAEEISSLGEQ